LAFVALPAASASLLLTLVFFLPDSATPPVLRLRLEVLIPPLDAVAPLVIMEPGSGGGGGGGSSCSSSCTLADDYRFRMNSMEAEGLGLQ